jgi:hypothetical protein
VLTYTARNFVLSQSIVERRSLRAPTLACAGTRDDGEIKSGSKRVVILSCCVLHQKNNFIKSKNNFYKNESLHQL